MKQRMRTGYLASAMALSLATMLAAGCGDKTDEDASAKAAGPAAAAGAKQSAASADKAQPGDERLATAVATSKSGAAVDLKYDIAAKPAVGQPFEVELTFMPRVSADSLEVEVSAVEGLTLVGSGGARFENVQAGERYSTKVLAQSGAAGVYYIGVAVKMSTRVQTEARTFSVPVVVGTPAVVEKLAPEKDASGEAVEPMPAVESGN